MHMSMIHRFYHCFFYHSEPFSEHFVARFITEHYFVTVYACSELRVYTIIAMAPQLVHGPAHRQYEHATLISEG